MCLNEVGGTILLSQNNKWIVFELKERNYLGLMSWLNIICTLTWHHNFHNSNEQNTSKLKIEQAHKKPDQLNELQILSASSFTSSILALPESRALCETDNANKVSTLLNTPEWLFMTFTKDGCFA